MTYFARKKEAEMAEADSRNTLNHTTAAPGKDIVLLIRPVTPPTPWACYYERRRGESRLMFADPAREFCHRWKSQEKT